jgi:hypothetical protein
MTLGLSCTRLIAGGCGGVVINNLPFPLSSKDSSIRTEVPTTLEPWNRNLLMYSAEEQLEKTRSRALGGRASLNKARPPGLVVRKGTG